MNFADHIYYVYNCKLLDFVQINIKRRDSRDFCHWLRALSIISQFNFPLSDSWRNRKNLIIDSEIIKAYAISRAEWKKLKK